MTNSALSPFPAGPQAPGSSSLLFSPDGCCALALLSAAVERLLVTYVDRETVCCPPNTQPSLGPLCQAAIDDLNGRDAVLAAAASASPDTNLQQS